MSIEPVTHSMLLTSPCLNSITIFCIHFHKSDLGEMILKAASKICEMALYSINIDVAPGRLY